MNIRGYELKHEIGRGGFGVTYLGYDSKLNRNVAIKTIKIAESGASSRENIMAEIDMLKDLTGDNCNSYVACYYDSFQDYFNGEDTIFIISEYVDGVSLYDFIILYQGVIPPNILWPIYTQLVLGLKYIHENGYAHRDIKLENILITKDYVIKYIDFGLSCYEKCRMNICKNTCDTNSQAGTIIYMPPEYFAKRDNKDLEAYQMRDIWALSLVMFELAHGVYNVPFNIIHNDNQAQMQEIIKAPIYSAAYNLDDGRTNLFLDLVVVGDVSSRPSIDTVKETLMDIIFSRIW